MPTEAQQENFQRVADGETIELAHFRELDVFENWAAETLLPLSATDNDTLRTWQGRVALTEMIRPRRFHGQYINLQVTPLEQAYQQLADRFPRSRKADEELAAKNTIGFYVACELVTAGKGVVDLLSNRFWIYRTGRSHSSRQTSGYYSHQVDVTNPRLKGLDVARAEAIQQGRRLASYAMIHPLNGGQASGKSRKTGFLPTHR